MDSGGPNATTALQIASIVAGLPFLIIMLMMCVATYTMLTDMENDDPTWKEDQQAIYDAQEAEKVANGKREPREMSTRFLEYCDLLVAQSFFFWSSEFNIMKLVDFLIAIVAPCVIMARTANRIKMGVMGAVWAGVCFFLFILFHCL